LIEGFRLRNYTQRRSIDTPDLPDGILRIGDAPLTGPLFAGNVAHRFIVIVPQSSVPNADAQVALERLINAYKPAHTAWRLIVIRPGIRVGCQSVIGVDTLLGSYPAEPLGAMQLGQSARTASTHVPRVGHARIGRSSAH